MNKGRQGFVHSWLQMIFGRSGGPMRETALPPVIQAAKQLPGRNEAIAYAAKLSGLVIDQPEAVAFYQAAFAKWPDPSFSNQDFRKQGDLLDKAALNALGLRANVKLSAQFLATLNEGGRADPLGAASVIGSTISTALCTCRHVGDMEASGIDLAKFHASNMATGPCSAAAKLDGQSIPVSGAPMLPFETCQHPGQCACFYQAWLAGLDD